MILLLIAAQAADPDALAFDAVRMAKLSWGTCIEVYATAAAMTDERLTPGDAAGAALGHCRPQQQKFVEAARVYLRNHDDVLDQVTESGRQQMREAAMAAVVDYRMKHPRQSQ